MAVAKMTNAPMTAEEKKVIFASSLGTVFEWYDFYLYGSLAAIIAKQFFACGPGSHIGIHFRAAGICGGLHCSAFGAWFSVAWAT